MTSRITAASRTGLVDLVHPDPKTITIEAIAHGLGQINRWNGALELPFSVAQHSILVMELFCRAFPHHRNQAIYALLHDAHEAYIGDWTTPVFKAFCRAMAQHVPPISGPTCEDVRELLKRRFDDAIYRALDVPSHGPSTLAGVDIHLADKWALAVEWRDFMPAANGEYPFEKPPFAVGKLKSLPPAVATEKFLEAFHNEIDLMRRAA